MPNRVALVTGGSRGIGRAICTSLAHAGTYSVVVNHRSSQEDAKRTLEMVEGAGAEGIVVQADVSDRAQVDRLFDEIEDQLGPVSILVNNAGIRRDTLALRMSDAQWDEVMATNLTAAFSCARRALRGMLLERWGRIVNVASIAGLRGVPGQANYCAAKAGLIGLTKALAVETAARNVTINALAPGLIDTDLTSTLPERRLEELKAAIPAGRAGDPQEVGAIVTFLCSEEASYVNGAVLTLDGAMTA